MSRIGNTPISIPKGVEVKVQGATVIVKGPKGSLSLDVLDGVEVKVEGDQVVISLAEAFKEQKNFHGLFRALINNMVVGTTQGFEKILEMKGVGYRATVQGNLLDLQVGFSHPTKMQIPEELQVKVEKNTVIFISGIDKQLVGQFSATVRGIRPPEPYKGKGIRYRDEHVRRKAGKAAKK